MRWYLSTGGKPREKLDGTRYQLYCEKLATNSSQIQAQNLPPTSAAARHHSLRVYLQVKQKRRHVIRGLWMEGTEGQILRRMTDLPAAPESLLQMIRCNCSSDCASARCTCCEHDLECSPACGHCRGTACTNSPIQFDDDSQHE